jgi:hypothetical protein
MALHPVSRRAGPRDRRPRDGRRRRRDQVQGWRHGRRGLPRRFMPHLPGLPRGPGAILHRHGDDLRQHGQASQRPDARRLRAEHRRDGGLRAPDARQSQSRRRRAAAVRGHHDLFPLRHWKVGPGQKVGIVGLGGLGHMGVKFAKAFGAHVVLFTTSPGKVADAKRLGPTRWSSPRTRPR